MIFVSKMASCSLSSQRHVAAIGRLIISHMRRKPRRAHPDIDVIRLGGPLHTQTSLARPCSPHDHESDTQTHTSIRALAIIVQKVSRSSRQAEQLDRPNMCTRPSMATGAAFCNAFQRAASIIAIYRLGHCLTSARSCE